MNCRSYFRFGELVWIVLTCNEGKSKAAEENQPKTKKKHLRVAEMQHRHSCPDVAIAMPVQEILDANSPPSDDVVEVCISRCPVLAAKDLHS